MGEAIPGVPLPQVIYTWFLSEHENIADALSP